MLFCKCSSKNVINEVKKLVKSIINGNFERRNISS